MGAHLEGQMEHPTAEAQLVGGHSVVTAGPWPGGQQCLQQRLREGQGGDRQCVEWLSEGLVQVLRSSVFTTLWLPVEAVEIQFRVGILLVLSLIICYIGQESLTKCFFMQNIEISVATIL